MNNQISRLDIPLLVIAFFSMTAFGLGSVMFNEVSREMAMSVGYSLDEMERVKVGFMIAQVLGFVFTPLFVRRLGTSTPLIGALSMSMISYLMLLLYPFNATVFWGVWLINGFALSMLLVVVNLLLLETINKLWLPAVIGFSLVFSTLLPMGVYPWLIANILENNRWQWFSVALIWLSFSALVVVSLFPRKNLRVLTKPKSSIGVYLLIAVMLSFVVFLLMRGSYYNWFDSILYSEWSVVAAGSVLLTVSVAFWLQPKEETASLRLHRHLKTNVFMYNAFLAGFAVMASTALFSNFLAKVLQYNSLNSGFAQLPCFITMIIGMLLSVWIFNYRRHMSDAVVPFGVLMILLSVYEFSQLPSNVDPETLLLPMLLRGFGIGLLNVSVTIAVLMYFKADERLEGICNFYLFRTIGGLIGGAYFSHVIQTKSAQASSSIGGSLGANSHTLSAYQEVVSRAILTHGHLPSSSLGMGQVSGAIKEQATTLALNNALLIFILSIFALAPVLIVGKKLAAKQSASEQP